MSKEHEVLAAIQIYLDARVRGDAETVLACHSEDWEDNKRFTKKALESGELSFSLGANKDAIEIDSSRAEVTLNGDVAILGPVVIDTEKGRITYRYTLKEEESSVWRLTYTQTLDWETFPMDDETQLLKNNIDVLAQTVRKHRETLLADPWRPGYHFTVPEGVAIPFDPNGAIYWKGRYHLFYIFQDKRNGIKSDHWGHVSSTDLFHWRHHPTGLLNGMYSGNCFINAEGVPTICYHQVDQGNAMAVAVDDELNEWTKLESNPITPATKEGDEHHGKYRSWDPYGWHDGNRYYAIFGGEHPGVVTSETLDGEWRYTGDLFAHGLEGVSLNEDVSCADLFKIGNKDVLLCISHRMGCRYYIGEWKNEQFYPESHAQMSWVDNSFFAPESLLDDKGRRIMWAWLLDFRKFQVRLEQGWSGTMSLPRVLSLNENNRMEMDVPSEIEALRYRPVSLEFIELQTDSETWIDGVSGNSIELEIDMTSNEATEYGVVVCASPGGEEKTVISYDSNAHELKLDTRCSGPEGSPKEIEAGPLLLAEGEHLQLRVFVDKSVVEVFANKRQAVMRRIYPERPDSIGVKVFSRGGETTVNSIQSWHISPSNPY